MLGDHHPADHRTDGDRILFGIGQRKRAVVAAAAQDPDQRALAVGVGLLARLPVSLRGAHFVGIDDREVHSGLVVVNQSEHAGDPGPDLIHRAARDLGTDAVKALGQHVGLLAQHRQEQFVLGLEVAVERPRRHTRTLQDRRHWDRTAVRFRQTGIRGIDDASAVITVGGLWLHVANHRDAARQPGRS